MRDVPQTPLLVQTPRQAHLTSAGVQQLFLQHHQEVILLLRDPSSSPSPQGLLAIAISVLRVTAPLPTSFGHQPCQTPPARAAQGAPQSLCQGPLPPHSPAREAGQHPPALLTLPKRTGPPPAPSLTPLHHFHRFSPSPQPRYPGQARLTSPPSTLSTSPCSIRSRSPRVPSLTAAVRGQTDKRPRAGEPARAPTAVQPHEPARAAGGQSGLGAACAGAGREGREFRGACSARV